MATLRISNFSRYKDTKVISSLGDVFFGLQRPPAEFLRADLVDGAQIHTVISHEVGFLDGLAVQYFGNGMERLWWVIAQANAMIDPEREMFAGQRLIIPPRRFVLQFLNRAGDNA